MEDEKHEPKRRMEDEKKELWYTIKATYKGGNALGTVGTGGTGARFSS